ncbi:hypothetical protein Gpo141_00011251 [Globisporangium polare]
MKSKLPEEVMPTLFLTQDEQLSVEKEADAMLRDSLDACQAFVGSGRAFPKDQWKRLKSKEGFEVYRTRKSSSAASAATLTRASSRASSSSSFSDHASAAKLEPSNPSSGGASASSSMATSNIHSHAMVGMQQFPVVVLTGIAPGTIEDVALGGIASTDAMWRQRNAYLNDHHRDCKILATLHHPSKKYPFNFTGVKWAYRKLPAFVQQRDMVYVEKVGATYNADGAIDTLYNLMHSIDLPGVPELSQYDILRIKVSICYITRRHDDKSIEYYCRAFLLPSGDVPTSIAAMNYADELLAIVTLIDCAHMKKLMWLTQQRRTRESRATSTTTTTNSSSRHQDTVESATQCQGCHRALKLFGGLNRSVSKCQCCSRLVCGKCSSERKVVLDASEDGEVTRKPLAFCVQCVVEARALPALDIAAATAGERYDNW